MLDVRYEDVTIKYETVTPHPLINLWEGALRLQQVLIKPRKTAAVHRRQSEGGLLTLVNTCGEIGLCTLFPRRY